MADLVKLHLETLFLLNGAGRIITTSEPHVKPGPVLILIQSANVCIRALHNDVSAEVVEELDWLAREGPPSSRTSSFSNVILNEWVAGEINAGRAPVAAVMENGHPVSVCFCARRSKVAAEAGVETAAGFRGRWFGSRVTAAWALEVRASGPIPLSSTDWSNQPSLALARKFGLIVYAVDWSITPHDENQESGSR